MAATDEIMSLVDIAEMRRLTLRKFEEEILGKIDSHVAAAQEKDYAAMEGDALRFVPAGKIPAYRRVQFVKMYLEWLRDYLKVMPDMPGMRNLYAKLDILAQPVKIDDVPDELTWACLYESRVRRRNAECAKFLAQEMPKDFGKRYVAARDARRSIGSLAQMKITSAGKVKFDPSAESFEKKPDAIYLDIPDDVEKNHPLYVLRKEGEKPILKKALIPQKGQWAVVTREMMDDLHLGEPLFQVSFLGEYVDMEAKIAEIKKGIPENLRAVYADAVPFFPDMAAADKGGEGK